MMGVIMKKRTIYRRTIILCMAGISLFRMAAVFAQVSEGGVPPSFRYQDQPFTRSGSMVAEIPVAFDVKELKKNDLRDATNDSPPVVSTLIDVSMNPQNAGSWTTLPDSARIWQLTIRAQGAMALMLYYSDFYIPEGGQLFLYNADKSRILGAYTHQTNPEGGRFATEFLPGEEMTLEYVASPNDSMLRIEIEAVGYGYNNLNFSSNAMSLRASSSVCEVNVNCEEGDVWQNQKKGACHILQRIKGKGYLCSAALLNNTAEDLKPYILTASHCYVNEYDEAASEDELDQWVFYFHYEAETCSGRASTSSASTLVGCKKIAMTATDGGSDGLLLLIKKSIPEDYNVYYNGWDKRNEPAQSGVSIHFPSGDCAKISTFKSPAVHSTFLTEAGLQGDLHAHWNIIFDETTNGHGITESGSSGSPLFNEKKLVVGTLTGGNSSCYDPYGSNLYGKFSYHWDKYQTDSTRMDVWLDPLHSGVESLAGRYHRIPGPDPVNLTAVYSGKSVQLTWQMLSGSPLKYYIFNNEVRIGETTTRSFTDQTPGTGLRTYGVSAVYAQDRESNIAETTLEVMEYKAPSNLSAMVTTSQKIALLWEAPVYEATIYWGERNAMYQVAMDDNKPFYFGQSWTKEDISCFHRKTITAVKFLPIRNNTYEVYIAQGNRTYRQSVTNPTYGQTNTITLTTPFVIDRSQALTVAIYASKVSSRGSEYPAVCDGGPAVQGKGDLYSYDAKKWMSLYEEEGFSDDYNCNFFVAAIVSSVEGEIPLTTNSARETVTAATDENYSSLRKASSPYSSEQISLHSVQPAPFPEVTGYSIYRDNLKVGTVSPTPTRYIDSEPLRSTTYQVSAQFGQYESDLSEPVTFTPTANMPVIADEPALYPVIFGDQTEIRGIASISRIEVYGANGKLWIRTEQPEHILSTQSLPSGLYFFRIYSGNTCLTLKGVKRL
ncbi:MAG: T9SS type A sorting domain-containing protein [Tannerella sp.]|nr:T9SS type A sorting domain-containing protein [Tannerella sp.]